MVLLQEFMGMKIDRCIGHRAQAMTRFGNVAGFLTELEGLIEFRVKAKRRAGCHTITPPSQARNKSQARASTR